MIRLEGRPGDERGFLHKKILGKITGALPGVAAGLLGGLVGKIAGGKGPPPPPQFAPQAFGRGQLVPVAFTSRPTVAGAAGVELGRRAKVDLLAPRTMGPSGMGPGTAVATGCPRGFRPDFITGRCEPAAGQEVGEAAMGRYGAALVPGIMQIDRAVCLRGMQLGNDGLCYNKSQISNKQRMWPRGRRPLLTGGEMRAIGVASRAGTKLDRTTTRLRALGMMKALPKPRKAKAPTHHHHP